jgi:hypothetical protein
MHLSTARAARALLASLYGGGGAAPSRSAPPAPSSPAPPAPSSSPATGGGHGARAELALARRRWRPRARAEVDAQGREVSRGTWWDRRWLTLVLDHAKEEGNGGPALFSRPPAVSRCSSFAFIISCRRLFQLPVRMVLGPIQRCSTQ